MKQDGERWARRLKDWETEFNKRRQLFQTITDYYTHQFAPNLLPVNIIFSFGRAMVPQLYFKNPQVAVTIKKKGDYTALALTLQQMDDGLIEAMCLKDTIKRMITNAYCYGRGIGKCGWGAESDDSLGYLPTLNYTDKAIWKLRQKIGPNRPWFASFFPSDYAFDSNVSDIDDTGWEAMRFELSAEQILEKPDLNRKMGDKVKEDTDPDLPFEFWEVWSKFDGQFFVIHDDKIVEDGKDIKIWPFYRLDFNWAPRDPFCISDANLILKLQDEVNEIKTQIHEHRRASLIKIIARKNAIDREGKAQLNSGKVAPVVEVDGNPSEVIMQFKPDIPSDLFTTANTTEGDVRNVVGFDRNQLGAFSQTRRTAKEADIVQQNIMLRLDERRDQVGDLIGQILVAVNDYCFASWQAPQVEQYAGQSDGWEQIADIQDSYAVKVVPDSTLPVGRQVQQQEAKELYMTLRGDPLIDQVKLRIKYLGAFETSDMSLINPAAPALPGVQPEQVAGAQGNLGAGQQGPAIQANGNLNRPKGVGKNVG
jgi:hypothetical protein